MMKKNLDRFFEEKVITNAQRRKTILAQLRKRKLRITDQRVIKYENSPTGKGFVGVAKSPLMPAKKGYGYLGVLLQTDNRTLVMCHECGKWMRYINKTHLESHGLDKKQYCKKYGLFITNGLLSDEMSQSQAERGRQNILKLNRENPEYAQQIRAEAGRRRKGQLRSQTGSDTVEYKNRYNTCERQIGYRLIEWVKKYKDLPSRSNKKGDGASISKVLFRRYGSVNNGFQHYGLPVRYRKGTSVELNAPNKKQLFFNYNKNYIPEQVWAWMVKQCPMLEPEAINMFADK